MQRTLCMCFILVISCATPYSTITFTESEYATRVIEALGTKDELYVKANEWLVAAFTSAKSVIQFQDKEAGVIIGKYLLYPGEPYSTMSGNYRTDEVYAIVDIRVKDGKVKAEIKPQGTWKQYEPGYSSYGYSKAEAKVDMNTMLSSLEKSLTKPRSEF
ncbi:MAG: DUF4468 domain-containing protein [Cyclobacteriaceae bacterium]|nr:DUF4468 domain-containing protein [Cyclobacteriaceae bacterium]